MKYHIEKNTVQETLVIPLFGRLVCSERFPELFSDPEAKRICDSLDYDFAEKRKKMESAAGLFGALEVAQRQYDLRCEVEISAAAWTIPSQRSITANAVVITSTCRM